MSKTLYARRLKPGIGLLALILLQGCGTIQPAAPRASAACVVWQEQPFWWPDRCEATPSTRECAELQEIGRIAVANNAARAEICPIGG